MVHAFFSTGQGSVLLAYINLWYVNWEPTGFFSGLWGLITGHVRPTGSTKGLGFSQLMKT